jgi:phage tail-like protein
VKAEWSFTRGWPTKWEVSELDASKSELSIETLEITHEGLKFKK